MRVGLEDALFTDHLTKDRLGHVAELLFLRSLRWREWMAKFKLISLGAGNPGAEAGFETWYRETHAPQICALPMVKSVQVSKVGPTMMPVPWQLMAVYEIEADSAENILPVIGEATQSGRLTMSSSINPESFSVFVVE
jgi:hypothetical protein